MCITHELTSFWPHNWCKNFSLEALSHCNKKNHFMEAILKIHYYGHHEYICECLHIQNVYLVIVYMCAKFGAFTKKCTIFFVKSLHYWLFCYWMWRSYRFIKFLTDKSMFLVGSQCIWASWGFYGTVLCSWRNVTAQSIFQVAKDAVIRMNLSMNMCRAIMGRQIWREFLIWSRKSNHALCIYIAMDIA